MTDTHQPPPDAQLMQALFGFMVTRSVSAVAELDVKTPNRTPPLVHSVILTSRRAAHIVIPDDVGWGSSEFRAETRPR